MKVQKTVLTVLCAVVCLWAAWMVVGVIGLARYQGPAQLLELIEVAMFMGAGVFPLLLAWWTKSARHRWLFIAAVTCLAYVTVLALNTLRLGLWPQGAVRLALWIVIATLVIRMRRIAPVPNDNG